MLTKDKAREITDKVIKEKTDIAHRDAKNYVEVIVNAAIQNSAEKGFEHLSIHIPMTIEDDFVIEIIKEHGFKVSNARGTGRYTISW